jgi:GNAT superfamily N-acetyltransferase
MKYLKLFDSMEFKTYSGFFTQYNGEKFTLSLGIRVDGGLNVGDESYYRLKYIIYSNDLYKETNSEELSKIGYAEIGREDNGDIVVLIDIKLKPKFRKSGYGREIIKEIVQTTKKGLHVYDIKKSAIKFWKKVGAVLTDKDTKGFIPKN